MQSRIVRLKEEPKKKSNRKRKKPTSKRKSTRKRTNEGSRVVRLRKTSNRSSSRGTRTAKKATNKATKKRPSRKRKTVSRTRATSKRRKTRKSKKWIQQAVPPSRRGKFKEWCKRKGYKGVNQRCINKAIKEGGHPAKMAQFAINVSRGKYRRPSTPKRRKNPHSQSAETSQIKRIIKATLKKHGLDWGDLELVGYGTKKAKKLGYDYQTGVWSAVLRMEGTNLWNIINYPQTQGAFDVIDDFYADLNEAGYNAEQLDHDEIIITPDLSFEGIDKSVAYRKRGNPPLDEEWTLIDEKTGMVLEPGDIVTSFRGEEATVVGFRPPHHAASTGRIHIHWKDQEYRPGFWDEYFPSVFDAKIVRRSAQRNPGGEQFVGENGTIIQPIQYF